MIANCRSGTAKGAQPRIIEGGCHLSKHGLTNPIYGPALEWPCLRERLCSSVRSFIGSGRIEVGIAGSAATKVTVGYGFGTRLRHEARRNADCWLWPELDNRWTLR